MTENGISNDKLPQISQITAEKSAKISVICGPKKGHERVVEKVDRLTGDLAINLSMLRFTHSLQAGWGKFFGKSATFAL